MGERRESKRSVQSTISHPYKRAHNEQDEKSKLTCCKEWGNDEKANVPSSQQSRIQTNVHTTNKTRNRNSPAARNGGTTRKQTFRPVNNLASKRTCTTNKMRNRNSPAARDG